LRPICGRNPWSMSVSLSCIAKTRTSVLGKRHRANLACRLKRIDQRQCVGEHSDIWLRLDGLENCTLAVERFCDHLTVRLRLQDIPESFTDHLMVVGNEDADHRDLPLITRARNALQRSLVPRVASSSSSSARISKLGKDQRVRALLSTRDAQTRHPTADFVTKYSRSHLSVLSSIDPALSFLPFIVASKVRECPK
jgi:hypothetical protein